MGMEKKHGRPRFPLGEARSEIIRVPVRPGEKKTYEDAAKQAGVSLAQWIRQKLGGGK